MIETKSLFLIPCQPSHLAALAKSKSELGKLLDVKIAVCWPQFPDAYQPPKEFQKDFQEYSWGTLFFILKKESCLIGSGGFKGKPDSSGTVEIGYEIATEYENLGYGTEAVTAMRNFAFTKNEVQSLIAHTLAIENASNRLLKKIGMKFDSEIPDPELEKIWKWVLNKKDYSL